MDDAASSLLDFILDLLRDPEAARRFEADPSGAVAAAGLQDVSGEDVHAILPVVLDVAPVTVLAPPERSSGTGGADDVNDPAAPTGHAGPGGGSAGVDAGAVTQLQHIVNTYAYTAVDDSDAPVDQSVHQNVWADGDVTQWFDHEVVVASGAGADAGGADAVGDDLRGPVVTGDDDVVGDHADVGLGDSSVHGVGSSVDDPLDGSFDDHPDTSFDDRSDASFDDSGTSVAVEDAFDDASSSAVDDAVDHHGSTAVDVDAEDPLDHHTA